MSNERPSPQECVEWLEEVVMPVRGSGPTPDRKAAKTASDSLDRESARLIREAYLDNPKPDTDRRDRRERMMAALILDPQGDPGLTPAKIASIAESLLDASDAIDAEASRE